MEDELLLEVGCDEAEDGKGSKISMKGFAIKATK